MLVPASYVFPTAHLSTREDDRPVCESARPDRGDWGLTRASAALASVASVGAAWSAAAALLA